MRSFRVCAVLLALLLPFVATPTALADEAAPAPELQIQPVHPKGLIKVGHEILGYPVNNEAGATWGDVEWAVDGEPVEGANTALLLLGPEHAGAMVSISATAVIGDERVRVTSEPFGPVLPGTPRAIFSFGMPFVGYTVEAQHSVLEPADANLTYQWTADGVAIPGATGEQIVPTSAMADKVLRVAVTVSAAGYETVTFNSYPDTVRGAVTADGRVEIGFTTLEKETVQVHGQGGTWDPVPATPSFQWLLDGAPISGETGRTLALQSAWNGRYVSMRVTWGAPHLKPDSLVSNSLLVEGIPVDVYTTPGRHSQNLREWNTTCEPYSRTTRCRTDIIATTVQKQGDGTYRMVKDWTFNNITYLPSPEALWKDNPLAHEGEWMASDGRRWKTECFAGTGPRVCRSFTWSHYVVAETGHPGHSYLYVPSQGWVFNNQVHVR